MSAPMGRQIPSYRITSIVPETDFQPATGAVPSHRVNFSYGDGQASYVLIPNTDVGSVDKVRTKVEAAVVALTDIMGLGQG